MLPERFIRLPTNWLGERDLGEITSSPQSKRLLLSSSSMVERQLFVSLFEDPFDSAREDRAAKEERDLSNASLLSALVLAASLSAVRKKDRVSAPSASDRGRGIHVFCWWFLVQGFGVFLAFLFFSFSFLSLLDLESFGKSRRNLSVLCLFSGSNLVSLGVLSNLDVQVVRSGW